MPEQEADVLELLARHELAIKDLYQAYARLFAGRAQLWSDIAAEEQRHADWLGSLQSVATPATRVWLTRNLKPEAIRQSIAYIEGRKAGAREGVDLRTALSVSRDLENALIERQFARVSNTAPAEFVPVLRNLVAESERHRRLFAEALAAL